MYQHILVATDNSEPATAAVDQACTLAGTVGAALSAVSALDTMAYGVADVQSEVGLDAMQSAAQSAVDAVASTATEAGIEVSTAVLSGSPTTVICNYAEDHDVELIGCRDPRPPWCVPGVVGECRGTADANSAVLGAHRQNRV